MSPTRFPGGLTTAKKTDPLGDFILPDMTTAHVYWEDFNYYRAADWSNVNIGGGTQALANIDGGNLLITTGTTINNHVTLTKFGEGFLFETGKKLWFETRFKIDDVGGSNFHIGLGNASTDDRVFFEKEGSAIFLKIEKDATPSEVDLLPFLTLVDDTFVRFGYFYDGKGLIKIFIDGVLVTTTSDLTNLPDDEELTPEVRIQTTLNSSRLMTIDYIFAAKER